MRKGELRAKSIKKWLRARRRRQACMKMPRRMHKERLGKVSSKIGIARKLNMKKRRKRMTGENENQMEVHCDEHHKLEEILGRKRMEG